jgi:uncharacterized membrane protein YjgN (DUF898 family)
LKGEVYMRFRKKDYIIFYVIVVLFYLVQMIRPNVGIIFTILIVASIPTLILGTITNFLFNKR